MGRLRVLWDRSRSTGRADLVPGYLAARREDEHRLRRLLLRESYGEIQSLGHNLKGTGAAYGLPQFSNLGRRIEIAARERDEAQLQALSRELLYLVDSDAVPRS